MDAELRHDRSGPDRVRLVRMQRRGQRRGIDIPLQEEPVSTQIQRRHRIPPEVALRVLVHFAANTPFAQIAAELGIDADVINRMFRPGWRRDLARLQAELHTACEIPAVRQPPTADLALAPVLAHDQIPVSVRIIRDIKALLKLGLEQDVVRQYIQLDRDTFLAAMRCIQRPAPEPQLTARGPDSDYDAIRAALIERSSLTSTDAQMVTGLNAAQVRPLLHRLVAAGAAKVEGQRRGTRYVAT